MFIVPQAQIDHLDSLYLDRLVHDLKTHIHAFFPEEYEHLDPDSRDDSLRDAIAKAKTYGLSTDRNITVFIDFMMTFGFSFPVGHDWGKTILENKTISEDQKIDSLLATIDQ